MLFRLSLIVAILAGLGALYFSNITVKEKISTITSDRDQARSAEQAAESAKAEALRAQQVAEEEASETKRQLTQTEATLQSTQDRLQQQTQRGDQLDQRLAETTRQRNEAQQELAAWRALGIPVEQVGQLIRNFDSVREQRDSYIAENKILEQQLKETKARLWRYEPTGERVELPPSLSGTVIAVDPKYQFAVLDIGSEEGALENGQMLVMRDGKLIGKVRITKLHPDRSIANVIPEWQQGEIMEGDRVVVQ